MYGEGKPSPRIPAGFIRACWVAVIALLVAVLPARADEREDEYLRIYENIQQADSLDASGKTSAAMAKYQQAHSDLAKFRKSHPIWNRDMVAFRLNYAAQKAAECNEKLNAAAASPPPPAAPDQTQATAPGKDAPTRAEPLVKLLEPGAEPRKALRFQPKAGDKQTVALTLKTAMDMGTAGGQSQSMKLPPVVIAVESAIKDVAADGDITYENVITDASVGDEPGAMPQVMEAMKASLAGVKGLIISGVMTSRGFSKRLETKAPKSGETLPANARLFSGQMNQGMATMTAALPEEPVGVGARWEVKTMEKSSGISKAIYEIVSLEGERVVAKATITQSALNQGTAPGKGEGSGEVTLDLNRTMPVAGQLTHRMSGSMGGSGQSKDMAMKMEMSLRIESK
jgi:hypothetical protein